MKLIKHIVLAFAAFAALCGYSCSTTSGGADAAMRHLADTLENVAAQYPARIGVALITDRGDTVTVNNTDTYPLMSVFKLHQAVAACHRLDSLGISLDSLVRINSTQLNPSTWSPMLKDHPEAVIELSVRDMMRYTLVSSDNNASNYMFDSIMGIASVDSFIATVIPRESFRLAVTEDAMWHDHDLCYDNHSSPLGVALLVNRLFSDSIVSPLSRGFICDAMSRCVTGNDRIAAPLAGKDGVTVAHKTGSGFRDTAGILAAHNDAAYITLPDGRHYTLVVLVRDFNGSERQASAAIARISAIVYEAVVSIYSGQKS